MNVLLAEAERAVQQLLDVEDINPELPQTDVVLVLGERRRQPRRAYDESSPIYGMPHPGRRRGAGHDHGRQAQSAPGFAAVGNELFDADNA